MPQNHHQASEAGRDLQPRAAAVPVEISGVSKVFQRGSMQTQALGCVDLSVQAGQFVAVVGPSGCGKSTLLKIIAGLLAPSEGSIDIAGKRIAGPHTDLGIVFQSPVLLDWRNVLDNVLVQIDLRGGQPAAYRDRALALLAKVGLAGF